MVSKLKLPNGINVLLINDAKTNLVMSTVNVSVGSNMETPDNYGIAHVCEHMLFHNKINGHDITKEIHRIGAHFNATTSYNQTTYYIITEVNDICSSIDMLFNIYVENSFTNEDIDKERNIIVEEYNMVSNSVGRFLIKETLNSIFDENESNKMMVIGTLENIKKFNKDDVVKYKKLYKPDITTLIFIGDIKKIQSKIVKTIKSTFAQVKGKTIVHPPKLNNLSTGFYKYIEVPDNKLTQCSVMLAFRGYEFGHRGCYSLDMISYIMNYFSLFEKLRLEDGNTYSSRTSILDSKDYGIFSIETQMEFKYLVPVLKSITDIIVNMKETNVTKDLINRTNKKLNIISNLMYQDFREFYKWYNKQTSIHRDINKLISPEEYIKKCSKINANDIKYTANDIFLPQNCCLAIIGPKIDKHDEITDLFSRLK